MAPRILAVVAAVAMVAAALVVRGNLDDGGDGSGPSGATPRIVCATELAAVCEALDDDQGSRVETTVEAVDETAKRLIALGPDEAPALDGWLVTAPWPEIVDGTRTRAGGRPLLAAGAVLARSPAVLAVRADRSEVLANACGGQASWKCLGEVAGKEWSDLEGGSAGWGTVKPGHPPARSAAGLTVLGAAAVGYFADIPGLSPADLSLTELADVGFRSWLRRLEQAQLERPGSPFRTMLQGRSAFDAVGVLEAEAGPALQTARTPKPGLLYPSPVVTADVVLATTGSRPNERLTGLLAGTTGRRALVSSGWRVAGEKPAAGVDASMPLPPASNLPAPDVLDALSRQAVEAGP